MWFRAKVLINDGQLATLYPTMIIQCYLATYIHTSAGVYNIYVCMHACIHVAMYVYVHMCNKNVLMEGSTL